MAGNAGICGVFKGLFRFPNFIPLTFSTLARRAGSDGSMSNFASAGPGFDSGEIVNFHLKFLNLGARRGGDVHLLIAILYTQLHKWLPEVNKQKFTHPPSNK